MEYIRETRPSRSRLGKHNAPANLRASQIKCERSEPAQSDRPSAPTNVRSLARDERVSRLR